LPGRSARLGLTTDRAATVRRFTPFIPPFHTLIPSGHIFLCPPSCMRPPSPLRDPRFPPSFPLSSLALDPILTLRNDHLLRSRRPLFVFSSTCLLRLICLPLLFYLHSSCPFHRAYALRSCHPFFPPLSLASLIPRFSCNPFCFSLFLCITSPVPWCNYFSLALSRFLSLRSLQILAGW
jgi:hypothetical protein